MRIFHSIPLRSARDFAPSMRLFASVLLPFLLLLGMSLDGHWDEAGDDWKEAYYSVIPTMGGQVAAAGYRETKENGKQILFQFFNKEGRRLGEPVLRGEAGDQVCHSVIQTFDGGYLLAGTTTEGSKKSNTNALLMKLTESGEPLWDTVAAATPATDALYDLIQLDDGSIVAVGESDGKPLMVKIDEHGRSLKILIPAGVEKGVLKAIAADTKGQLAATGTQKTDKKDRLLLLTFDSSLTAVATIPDNAPGEKTGADILYDQEKKGWWIAVNTPGEAKQSGMAFWNTEKIEYQWHKRRYENPLYNLVHLPSGKVVAFGYSSDSPGFPALYYPFRIEWNPNGKSVIEKKYPTASGIRTWALSACVLPDGQIITVGAVGMNENNAGAWLKKEHEEKIKHLPNRQSKITLLTDLREPARDSNRAGILEGDERCYLALRLRNEGDAALRDSKIYVQLEGPLAGVSYFPVISPGTLLAGTTRPASVPLYGDFDLNRDTLKVSAIWRDANNRPLDSFSIKIPTREAPIPKLQIDSLLIGWSPDSVAAREKPITIWAIIKNIGRDTAQDVRLDLGFPYLVESLQRDSVIARLPPGASCRLPLRFSVNWMYPASQAVFTARAYEDIKGHYYSTDYAHFPIRIADYFEVQDRKGRRFVPEGLKRRRGGRAPILNYPVTEPQKLIWELIPDSAKNAQKLKDLKDRFGSKGPETYISDVALKVKLYGFGAALPEKSIQVQLNGKPLPANNKSSLRDLGDGTYLFVQYLYLKPEKNEFIVTCNGTTSEPFLLYYRKPNLHVFSVGIRQPVDGQPEIVQAANDARALDSIFRGQSGFIFENVIPRSCFEKNDTYTTNLERYFGDISKMSIFYHNSNEKYPIKPQDYVLLFISAHGNFDGKLFFIPSIEADGKNGNSEINDVIFSKITFTQNQRYFFIINTCHSGALVKTKNEWFDTYFRKVRDADNTSMVWNRERVTLITAAAEDQKAWIPAGRKHTVFFEALLDALTAKKPLKVVNGGVDLGSGTELLQCSPNNPVLTTAALAPFTQKKLWYLSDSLKLPRQTMATLNCDSVPFFYRK